MYRVLRTACACACACMASAKGDFDGPKRCSVCRYARKALVCTKDWKKGLSLAETLAGAKLRSQRWFPLPGSQNKLCKRTS